MTAQNVLCFIYLANNIFIFPVSRTQRQRRSGGKECVREKIMPFRSNTPGDVAAALDEGLEKCTIRKHPLRIYTHTTTNAALFVYSSSFFFSSSTRDTIRVMVVVLEIYLSPDCGTGRMLDTILCKGLPVKIRRGNIYCVLLFGLFVHFFWFQDLLGC